jgi:transcriptional regulator with XRE-family HTH domain
MTAKANGNRSKMRTRKPSGPAGPAVTTWRNLRDVYGLNDKTLARMLGVSEATLAKWQTGATVPDAACLESLNRLARIPKALARVMKKGFILTWLVTPNAACAGRAPADLLAARDFSTVEDIVYFLEAGEPV